MQEPRETVFVIRSLAFFSPFFLPLRSLPSPAFPSPPVVQIGIDKRIPSPSILLASYSRHIPHVYNVPSPCPPFTLVRSPIRSPFPHDSPPLCTLNLYSLYWFSVHPPARSPTLFTRHSAAHSTLLLSLHSPSLLASSSLQSAIICTSHPHHLLLLHPLHRPL